MSRSTREDLKATLAARRDLGPDYEDALVESFLDKLDQEITARVRGEVASNARYGTAGIRAAKEDRDRSVGVALGSLGIGVPLTAIAAGTTHGPGLVVAWAGIIAVNFAYAIGRRRRRDTPD
ncbi:hypothetical protein J5X84_20835 [Streptosporangiaceae bacterium NEAU-GS5]|nr:hypothetical protein [Streptosporangiaceae bacterium NEAU-GS5]